MHNLTAKSKINLFLSVGKRNKINNLHDISACFCRTTLADRIRLDFDSPDIESTKFQHTVNISNFQINLNLEIEIKDELERQLRHNNEYESTIHKLYHPDNLIFKTIEYFFNALVLFNSSIELPEFINLKLEKYIPLEAGLGGGSADASSVLSYLSGVYGLNDKSILSRTALEIGNDVLPCMYNYPVYFNGSECTKVKDEITSLPVILIKPSEGSSTKDAFRSLNRPTYEIPEEKAELLNSSFNMFDPDILFKNDFQSVASKFMPEFLYTGDILKSCGASRVLLNGSGSSVTGIYKDSTTANKSFSKVRSLLDLSWFVKLETLEIPVRAMQLI